MGGAVMSWEEMYTHSTVCPCGKGKITQTSYGDDWNRFKDGPVIITCGECSQKYMVKEISHHGLLTSDGCWSEYFLFPKDFHDYDGPCESKTYGPAANPNCNITGWLIENFTEDELKVVGDQLHQVKASSMLIGNAAYICKVHKSAMKTVKVSAILASVEKALGDYHGYAGNKTQREKVRMEENAARSAYLEERRKRAIPICFE
jgi:hypothetical protein